MKHRLLLAAILISTAFLSADEQIMLPQEKLFHVILKEDVNFFSFMPSANGEYRISTNDPDRIPLYFILLDRDMNEITDSIKQGTPRDGLRFRGDGGELYHIAMGLYDYSQIGATAGIYLAALSGQSAQVEYFYGGGKSHSGKQ